MKLGKIFKVMVCDGTIPAFEVHAEQGRKYEKHPSFEELGPGYHHEVTLGTYEFAANYCRARGYEPVYVDKE